MSQVTKIVMGKTVHVYARKSASGRVSYWKTSFSKYKSKKTGKRKKIGTKRISKQHFESTVKTLKGRRTRELKLIIKKRKQIMKKKEEKQEITKPVYRIAWGRTWYSTNKKSGAKYSIMTTYGFVFTRNPNFDYGALHRSIVDYEKKYFMRGLERTDKRVFEEENYVINGESYDGFEKHIVDEDEVVGGLDEVHLSAVYYENDGDVKWRREAVEKI